jgi:hypothetical protein
MGNVLGAAAVPSLIAQGEYKAAAWTALEARISADTLAMTALLPFSGAGKTAAAAAETAPGVGPAGEALPRTFSRLEAAAEGSELLMNNAGSHAQGTCWGAALHNTQKLEQMGNVTFEVAVVRSTANPAKAHAVVAATDLQTGATGVLTWGKIYPSVAAVGERLWGAGNYSTRVIATTYAEALAYGAGRSSPWNALSPFPGTIF